MKQKILVTGGAGYIGSHTALQLLERGYEVVVYDNLSNSNAKSLDRVRELSGKHLAFVHGDVRDVHAMSSLFREHEFHAVLHFAGLKSVKAGEENPGLYYDVNAYGTRVLLREMKNAGVRTIVFSSSATVYGNSGAFRYTEDLPLRPTNTYGCSKKAVEDYLQELYSQDHRWQIAILRYFNPVGAHASGLLGEDPRGVPNNLMPIVANVAAGQQKELQVFGNRYRTPDGTCQRDYLHVDDLARGHLLALEKVASFPGILTVNLGTGIPTSVLELVSAFEAASGRSIPYRIVQERLGDLASYYADPTYASQILGWKARYDISRMCLDVWRWKLNNPNGYE